MKIQDFLSDKNISKKEKEICLSVYANQDKTEEGWTQELTGNVQFSTKKKKEAKPAETPKKVVETNKTSK